MTSQSRLKEVCYPPQLRWQTVPYKASIFCQYLELHRNMMIDHAQKYAE